MNPKLTIKLLTDLGLTVSVLAAFAYHLTGPAAHEWVGLAMFVLLLVHNGLNWRWYRTMGRVGAGLHSRLSLAVTLVLLTVAVTLLITSLLVSREIFSFIQVNNGFLLRQIHTLAAYWILVLMSVHVGLHWPLIMAVMGQLFPAGRLGRRRAALARLAGASAMLGGLWACLDRGLGAKLLMRHSFDYWAGSAAGFFTTYLLIMALFIGLTHYSLLFYKRRQARRERNQLWRPAGKKLTMGS